MRIEVKPVIDFDVVLPTSAICFGDQLPKPIRTHQRGRSENFVLVRLWFQLTLKWFPWN